MAATLDTECAKIAGLKPTIVLFGGGNMATALACGLIDSGFCRPAQLEVCCRSEETAKKWRALGVRLATTGGLANCTAGSILVLAVKPQQFQQLTSDAIPAAFPVVISLLAGVSIDGVRAKIASGAHIVRVLPNLAVRHGKGATCIFAAPGTPDVVTNAVLALCSVVGSAEKLSDESQFNAAGVLVGCAPAWLLVAAEALADGGVLSGLPRAVASRLAASAVSSAGALLLPAADGSAAAHPAVQKDAVCSPAGTTIAGLRVLERQAVRSALIEALKAATDRADELGGKK